MFRSIIPQYTIRTERQNPTIIITWQRRNGTHTRIKHTFSHLPMLLSISINHRQETGWEKSIVPIINKLITEVCTINKNVLHYSACLSVFNTKQTIACWTSKNTAVRCLINKCNVNLLFYRQVNAVKIIGVIVVTTQTTSCTHPQFTVLGYIQSSHINASDRTTILYRVFIACKVITIKPVQSTFCSKPYKTIFILYHTNCSTAQQTVSTIQFTSHGKAICCYTKHNNNH